MMQNEPCSYTLMVQHIVLGFFSLVSTCFGGWLVHRRYLADKRERKNGDSTSHREKQCS